VLAGRLVTELAVWTGVIGGKERSNNKLAGFDGSLPASSTMPQYSCPIGIGSATGWMPRYGHKSDPHTHVAEILIMASVGLIIFGVSRSSKRRSLDP
jgi:hypothetical protein